MSFAERYLKFTFSGAPTGAFSASGLRAVANIQAVDGQLGVTGQVKIWGLTLGQMNAYSTAIPTAINDELPDANLIIEAGDVGGSTPVEVINAPIWSSCIDLTELAESAFVVSVAGISDAATPVAPQSQAGVKNAEDLIAALCAAAVPPLTFDNSAGAHAVLRNMSTYGSAIEQIGRIARAAGFRYMRRGTTLSIWPQGGTVDDVVINLGPRTEPRMVGYPTYWELGIIVTSLFNSQIQVGRQMNIIDSIIKKANGLWSIVQVEHSLSTMMAKGPWFTTAKLAGPGG